MAIEWRLRIGKLEGLLGFERRVRCREVLSKDGTEERR